MSTYLKHDRVVKLAAAEIGVKEDPYGSNRGKRVREYQDADWLPGTSYPWCASFACWVWKKAGFNLRYLGAGAYKWYDDGAELVGRKIPPSRFDQVIPGDGVVFRIGAGHIGIVEKIQDGAIHSIDGNVAHMVSRRVRALHSVYGFVGLDEKAVPPSKPPKAPMWEVVTSASGHRVVYVSGIKAISLRLPRFVKKYGGVVIRRRKVKK